MRRSKELTAILKTLGQPARGSFVRALSLMYAANPLSAAGSKRSGGRYNPKSAFEMLYLTEHPDTVLREKRIVVRDSTGAEIAVPIVPTLIVSGTYNLQHVVDLTSETVRERLDVSLDTLLAEWEPYVLRGKTPPTQRLGSAAHDAGVEALLVPSARFPNARNLTVIVDRLRVGSAICLDRTDGLPLGTLTELHGTRPSGSGSRP